MLWTLLWPLNWLLEFLGPPNYENKKRASSDANPWEAFYSPSTSPETPGVHTPIGFCSQYSWNEQNQQATKDG